MIFDTTNLSCFNSNNHNFEESLNEDVQKFYMLDVAQHPLWLGCTTHMELSIARKMFSIKIDYNAPHGCFDEMMMLLKEN